MKKENYLLVTSLMGMHAKPHVSISGPDPERAACSLSLGSDTLTSLAVTSFRLNFHQGGTSARSPRFPPPGRVLPSLGFVLPFPRPLLSG